MVWSLREIFTRWKNDPAVGHVVLSSSSLGLFVQADVECAIHLVGDSNAAEQFFRGEYLADLAIAEFDKPIIVLCDGLAGRRAGLTPLAISQ